MRVRPVRFGRRVLTVVLAGAAIAIGLLAVRDALYRGRTLREAFPTVDGSIPVSGLRRAVTVIRDPRSIPHIAAVSETDAYRALGFVHAQDRLAQMIWLRRSAQGRLAAVLGPGSLRADREARMLGIARHAERALEGLPRRTRALLAAYVGGVNAQIDRIRAGEHAPPLALRRLGIPLDDWQEADSVAVLKLYAWALVGGMRGGLVLQDLIEDLGGFGARPFFPPGVGLEILPDPQQEARSPFLRLPAGGDLLRGPSLRQSSGLVGHSLGSSAFVLSGRHTSSGLPILAADSHLPARAPSLLYQAHLSWHDGLVAGSTIPGIPLFWTGHNGRVAWSAVNAGAVVADLYMESLHPDGRRYHDGRRWRELGLREEEIQVLGGETLTFQVRETNHGPLLDDLAGERRAPVALAWSGARRGDPLTALFDVSRAADSAALRTALERHHEPVVVVVYADRAGVAGFQMAGWIPQRSLPTGLVPVPGRNRWYAWSQEIAFDLLPRTELDESGGSAVAADARLTSAEDPVVIEWLWRTGARSRRIHELLRVAVRKGKLGLREALELQRDVASPQAKAVVEAALALAGPPAELGKEERWVAEALRSWDWQSQQDSRTATLYHVFLHRLLDALMEPWIGPKMAQRYLAIPHVDPVYLARRLLSFSSPAPSTEARRSLGASVRKSLRDTWVWLSVKLGPNQDRWSWGHLHRLSFRPLWPGGGWDEDSLGPFPIAGDGATVSVAEYDPTSPFDVRLASTFRLAIDLAAPGEMLTSLAPGQSGHPGHPHSVDGVERWLGGRTRLLVTSPLLVEETAAHRLVLEPEP